MNLQLLAESANAHEAMTKAIERPLVTVEPKIERREGGPVLVIPHDAGYGIVEEPMSALN